MAGDHSTADFAHLADLASARLGGRAIAASDDFFAPQSNLVKPEPPIFIPGKFTTRGKWMDGWESRRRRTPGHDWCMVALGLRGSVAGVDIDTSYFNGNHPSHASIDALDLTGPLTRSLHALEGPPWTTILDKVDLKGTSHNLFAIDDRRPWTHVRLNAFPDGGVARLRVYGQVEIDWARRAATRRPIDLAGIVNGGLVLSASDMHFGARDNLIMPGRAANMGDGWETRRRRGPGYDSVIVRLGTAGVIRRVEIDTSHFKGNYPESASVDAGLTPDEWWELLPRTKLQANKRHVFDVRRYVGRTFRSATHVRLNIFPDGGVSRLRVYGTVAAG